tara:strand:- start:52 stop:558 length:507 start_codon:yes stop_codon:yes gene_type:complete
MKKFLPLIMLVMAGIPAHAGGIVTKHQSSLQHSVDAGYKSYTRVGNSYSISGTNVTTTHTPDGGSAVSGGIGVNSYSSTTGVASIGSITGTQTGSGSFSFSQSFTQGDAAGSGSDEALFGNQVHYTGGTAGSGSVGTVTNGHAVALTGTNTAGTTTTGQFVSEISVFD